MNTLSTIHLAESLARQRGQDTAAQIRREQLLAAAGVDHPLRRRLAQALTRLGQRIAPQSAELAPASHTTQPC